MADANQKWPKTPDGTTDWEVVFESATSGFVPLVAQARTSEALGQCTKLIIHKLFTRDADGAMVEKFIADLDAIVSGVSEAGELAETRERVIGLLREIKDDRLQRAEAYIARKKSEKAGERRHARKAGKLKPLSSARKVATFKRHHKRVVFACLVLLLALVGAIVFLTDLPMLDLPGDGMVAKEEVEPASRQRPVAVPEPQPAEGRKKAPAKPPAKPSADPAPVRVGPPVIVMRPVTWSIRLPGRRVGTVAYLPRLSLVTVDDYAKVCGLWPKIFDTLNLTLNKMHPKGRRAIADDLFGMGRYAAKSINAMFDKATIKSVSLISNDDPAFRVTSKHSCRLVGGK